MKLPEEKPQKNQQSSGQKEPLTETEIVKKVSWQQLPKTKAK